MVKGSYGLSHRLRFSEHPRSQQENAPHWVHAEQREASRIFIAFEDHTVRLHLRMIPRQSQLRIPDWNDFND
jgi:hypothetical protein